MYVHLNICNEKKMEIIVFLFFIQFFKDSSKKLSIKEMYNTSYICSCSGKIINCNFIYLNLSRNSEPGRSVF